jgi:predicted N-acetyltransferase YhbS
MLRKFRLVHSTAGMWEAADLQWWWRKARRSDTREQLFWADTNGRDVAATLLTDWGGHWGLDPIVVPGAEEALAQIWPSAMALLPDLPDLEGGGTPDVHMYVVDDDEELTRLATAAGFVATAERGASCWMSADRRPPIERPPSGYRLADRVVDASRPHPMISRNGPQVAERLAATPLYRPELDLCMRDGRGAAAAYGLFWFDPVTAIGHVEPMRTEDAHQGKGLARCLLAEGLERLAALGARRVKVNHELSNPAATQLFRGAGFERVSTHTGWVRAGRAGSSPSAEA